MGKKYLKQIIGYRGILSSVLAMIFIVSCSVKTPKDQTEYAKSFDGERIAYHTGGRGEVTLLFVHGWCCDNSYWREQVPAFEKKYKVITMDLAGHGDSGHNRKIYSVDSYGQDVKAVMEASDAKNVIVIGHSMGGEIVATAAHSINSGQARMEPNPVIGIIGVDTLHNVEEDINDEIVQGMTDGMKKDFKGWMKNFVEEITGKEIKPELKKRITAEMVSAPPDIAINTFEQYVDKLKDKKIARLFMEIKVPVRCVNADLWPMDAEANRKYMADFGVKIMKGAGHFPMLERPEEFNKLLEESIEEITSRK